MFSRSCKGLSEVEGLIAIILRQTMVPDPYFFDPYFFDPYFFQIGSHIAKEPLLSPQENMHIFEV